MMNTTSDTGAVDYMSWKATHQLKVYSSKSFDIASIHAQEMSAWQFLHQQYFMFKLRILNLIDSGLDHWLILGSKQTSFCIVLHRFIHVVELLRHLTQKIIDRWFLWSKVPDIQQIIPGLSHRRRQIINKHTRTWTTNSPHGTAPVRSAHLRVEFGLADWAAEGRSLLSIFAELRCIFSSSASQHPRDNAASSCSDWFVEHAQNDIEQIHIFLAGSIWFRGHTTRCNAEDQHELHADSSWLLFRSLHLPRIHGQTVYTRIQKLNSTEWPTRTRIVWLWSRDNIDHVALRAGKSSKQYHVLHVNWNSSQQRTRPQVLTCSNRSLFEQEMIAQLAFSSAKVSWSTDLIQLCVEASFCTNYSSRHRPAWDLRFEEFSAERVLSNLFVIRDFKICTP